jgi:predicted Zn-dependent protease
MRKFFLVGLSAWCVIMLSACAGLPPGWAEYKEAMKCHFQNKNEECNQEYESAIKKNPKLPGLQASYASHLFQHGNAAEAEEHFRSEQENHPRSQQAIAVVMKVNADSLAKSSPHPQSTGR